MAENPSNQVKIRSSFLEAKNNHFGDCLPGKCGELEIQYPFHILKQQNPYCGYPGFEVTCNKNGVALFNLSGDTYMIKKIWYDVEKFQVVNSAFVNGVITSTSGCLDSLKNVSLDKDHFLFATNHSDMYVFPNCSNKVLEKYKDKRVRCGGVAVDGKDSILSSVEKECNGVVKVPFYDDEGEKSSRVIDSLERGLLLNWEALNCTPCTISGGECGFDVVNNQFNCYCSDRTHALQCTYAPNPIGPIHKLRQSIPRIIVPIASSLGVVLFIALLIIYAKRRQGIKKFSSLWSEGTNMNQNVEAFLKSYGSLAPTRYTYAEIKRMTNNFEERLGEGGYGVVYKGKLQDSRLVAVKNLKKLGGDDNDFINEVVSIGRTNHVNIVTLLGFCFEGEKRALVYEFLPNGSLERFIYSAGSGQSLLSSNNLLSIAHGVAKGLDYLHRGCNMRILHFDIKPHNILLDEELCPKISDFGMARLCPIKGSLVSMSEARGTIGYIAPEVFCRNFGGVSHKSDVYSYGMMLLDLVCGRKNVAIGAELSTVSSEKYFPDWIYNQLESKQDIEVHELRNDEEKELHKKLILVGLWCIQSYPSTRPPINKVIEMLEGPLDSLQLPPKSDLSSPPLSVYVSSNTLS